MSQESLCVTFLDVGWGDSLFIEVRDAADKPYFALVDCNDTVNYPSSRVFLKRYFERLGYRPLPYPVFEHVIVTHAHADHVNGIQDILRKFGTNNLYTSRCDTTANKNMT